MTLSHRYFFRRLQQLKIRTRRAFLGSRQGGHTSLRRGHGLEFADYRLYSPGDDFRHIDWSVYGRTDRLYLRQFREEQDLNVMLLIDGSNSMAFPEGEGKFKLAQDLAVSLGYVALADGDSVTFSLLGHRNSPRYSGARALSRALAEVRSYAPGGVFNFEQEIRGAIDRQRTPGKCFFISDFLFPHVEQIGALDLLRSRNFEIAVMQILSPSELALHPDQREPVFVDSETNAELAVSIDGQARKEYGARLAAHIQALESYCFSAGIIHVLLSSREKVTDVVLSRLPELGLLK